MTLKEKLDNLVKDIGDVAIDLTTIDVATMTGNIDIVVDITTEKLLDPTALYATLKGLPQGNLAVVAMTHVELDNDRMNFYMPAADEKLITMHNQSVDAAIDTRNAVLEFFKGLIKI